MKTTQQWFNDTLKEFEEGDPHRFKAEGHLLSLTCEICHINGQPKGYKAVLMWLLEYCADKLINSSSPNKLNSAGQGTEGATLYNGQVLCSECDKTHPVGQPCR